MSVGSSLCRVPQKSDLALIATSRTRPGSGLRGFVDFMSEAQPAICWTDRRPPLLGHFPQRPSAGFEVPFGSHGRGWCRIAAPIGAPHNRRPAYRSRVERICSHRVQRPPPCVQRLCACVALSSRSNVARHGRYPSRRGRYSEICRLREGRVPTVRGAGAHLGDLGNLSRPRSGWF